MNGNQTLLQYLSGIALVTPHSLRKLIEWKRAQLVGIRHAFDLAPHSLRKLIEWKPDAGGTTEAPPAPLLTR